MPLALDHKENDMASWIVIMTRTVRTEVIVDNCTEDQAWTDPFEYSVDELELEQLDWDVESVEENK